MLWSRRQVGIIEAAHWLSIGEVGQRLHKALTQQITDSRQIGANAGIAALKTELPTLPISERGALVGLQFYSSIITARRYVSRWVSLANESGLPRVDAAHVAMAAMRDKGQQIVTTETSMAFSESRKREARRAHAEARSQTVILERWDSTLDQMTCPICDQADGETIRLSDDFVNGPPGAVHSRCRCTSHFLYEDPFTAHLLAD